MKRLFSVTFYALAGVIGLVAFLYPFLLPAVTQVTEQAAHQAEAPLLTILLLTLCVGALLVEMQGQAVNARIVAVLGVLVAFASVLRFIDFAIPIPGGFSPIFSLIILAGYVMGSRFGFLLGSLSLLSSALVTGGVGPWLPYQMFAAGWMGMTAGWLPHPRRSGLTILLLAGFGVVWGFLYGAIMNLYFWPFLATSPAMGWQPGAGWPDGLQRYAAFYATTSLIWDAASALGNAALLLILGAPVVRALTRFRDRFHFVQVSYRGSG